MKKINKRKIENLTKKLVRRLSKNKFFLGIMESCSGGALANEITNVIGASEVFKGAIVAYSTEIKIKFGISKRLIKKYSVYSLQVALEMAKKIRKILKTDIGVGITGSLSRPDPKEKKSKVGEVFVAVIFKNKKIAKKLFLPVKKREVAKRMAIYQGLVMIDKIVK